MSKFDLATPSDIRFGAGRVSEVPDACAGLRRVLVVTGADRSRADRVRDLLARAGIASTVFGVAGEPSVDSVRDGVASAAGCDGVLGYGGGSALDAAKAVAALAASGTDPLDHLEVVGQGRPLQVPPLPCIAVPTTAGTGSEVTRNAVLSAGAVKASLRGPQLVARVAIIDPDLLVGVPPATVAASGSDALSQVIEPFLSARANPLTDALARDGITRSARSLCRGWQGGLDDPQVREDLALTSLFGGLCLANAGLGAVHGFAGAFGARYDAPHGGVCGALLAPVVAGNLAAMRRRGHPGVDRITELARLLTGRPDAVADDAAPWLEQLRRDLQMPGLASYGARSGDIPQLIAQARQASSMKANPVELDEDELAGVLTAAL